MITPSPSPPTPSSPKNRSTGEGGEWGERASFCFAGIPVIPENAPFTPEQRAYLNGFFAGLFSRTPASPAAAPSPTAQPLRPLTILFGSQTGNAEGLAKRAAKEAGKQDFAAAVFDMAHYPR